MGKIAFYPDECPGQSQIRRVQSDFDCTTLVVCGVTAPLEWRFFADGDVGESGKLGRDTINHPSDNKNFNHNFSW
jgi:hypothetical protein